MKYLVLDMFYLVEMSVHLSVASWNAESLSAFFAVFKMMIRITFTIYSQLRFQYFTRSVLKF